MMAAALAAPAVILRLSVVRKMVAEASRNGWLAPEEAARLTYVPNLPERGNWLGNWLTREQARELLRVPHRATLIGKRDYLIPAPARLRAPPREARRAGA